MYTTTIPAHLQSTQELIQRAFPFGIDDDAYLPLLILLEPELSDRNLALVIAHSTNKDYSQVLHDIYQIQSHSFDNSEQLETVRSLLNENGFSTWLESD